MEAIYLKACFVESEIQSIKKRSFLAFWEFRGRYPTLLTETAGICNPENPVLPHNLTFPGSGIPWIFRTSLGVDFSKVCEKSTFDFRYFWIFLQILFGNAMEIDAELRKDGIMRNSVFF